MLLRTGLMHYTFSSLYIATGVHSLSTITLDIAHCMKVFFFCCGTATQRESWPSHSWGFLDHTQRLTTVGRTPLDEWSARRRDLYLTKHNTHNRQTSMPPVGFEPTISAGERPQTYALDRAATGSLYAVYLINMVFLKMSILSYLRHSLYCTKRYWVRYYGCSWNRKPKPFSNNLRIPFLTDIGIWIQKA